MQIQKYSENQHPFSNIIIQSIDKFEDFLQRGRQMMDVKIREYYYSL